VVSLHLIEALSKADSIAIAGASPVEGKVGNTILKNILTWGFKGRIYPINPKYDVILGIKAYRSIEDLPQAPDILVIATPGSEIASLINSASRFGTKLAVIISSSMEGDQNALKSLARSKGPRIIGPNSAGISLSSFDLHASIEIPPTKGRVGIIAQSGAVGGALISYLADLSSGASFFFSLGNSLDVGVEEALEYAAYDSSTESVVAYVEWVREGGRFLSSLKLLRERGKPVCILKGGRGETSIKAASSHTGGIASDYSIFKAAVNQAGGYLASDIDELAEICEVLRRIKIRGKGIRPLLVTNSGGVGVIAASFMDEFEIKIVEPSLIEILPERFRKKVKLANPLDLGGDSSIDDALEVLRNEEIKKEFDISVLIYVPTAAEGPEKIGNAVKNASKSFSLPTIGLFAGAGSREVMKQVSSHIPVVSSSSNLARAILALEKSA